MSKRVGLRTMGSIGAKVTCKVDVVVQENSTPNATHMVTINGVNYHNGDTAVLGLGDYTLTWASGNGGIFSSWGTSGKLSVADPTAESTTLTVTCGGILTLNMVACPVAGIEQITNGDFETGDFTGWGGINHTPPPPPPETGISVQKKGDYWTGIDAYEGTYYCGSNSNGDYGSLTQSFSNPIPVACFTESPVFEIHVLGGYLISPLGGGKVSIDIEYDDATITTVDWEASEANADTWQTINLKPYLESGKKVTSITIRINYNSGTYAMVDGISCVI